MSQIAFERIFGEEERFLEEPTFLQGTVEAGEWFHPSQGEEEERKTLLTASDSVSGK